MIKKAIAVVGIVAAGTMALTSFTTSQRNARQELCKNEVAATMRAEMQGTPYPTATHCTGMTETQWEEINLELEPLHNQAMK